uniref:Uncharacterized protein n=1 Tax=Rhizophora mucronata TaxID=61149 RepID=A0A2P2N3D5_RHIMU
MLMVFLKSLKQRKHDQQGTYEELVMQSLFSFFMTSMVTGLGHSSRTRTD